MYIILDHPNYMCCFYIKIETELYIKHNNKKMSVYPEFLQYIHDEGLYVPGYNYEEMYNIMIYTLTHNIIPTTNFIYTYQQVDELYECLEELLTPIDTESDTNETNEPQGQIQNNNQNQTQDVDDSDSDDIITIENPEVEYPYNLDMYNNHNHENQSDVIDQPQYTENEPDAQTVFNNYIHMLNNPVNLNHINNNHTNLNNTNQNIYYTNLTYNNMNTYINT